MQIYKRIIDQPYHGKEEENSWREAVDLFIFWMFWVMCFIPWLMIKHGETFSDSFFILWFLSTTLGLRVEATDNWAWYEYIFAVHLHAVSVGSSVMLINLIVSTLEKQNQ